MHKVKAIELGSIFKWIFIKEKSKGWPIEWGSSVKRGQPQHAYTHTRDLLEKLFGGGESGGTHPRADIHTIMLMMEPEEGTRCAALLISRDGYSRAFQIVTLN